MIKEEIHLSELAASRYGLVISPMLASYVPQEDVTTAYELHRHDSHALFLLKSGEMTILLEGHHVSMKSSSMLLVQPGQVHQCLQSHNISGWIIFFDGKFLDRKIRAVIEHSNEDIAFFQLNSEELLYFNHVLLSIYQTAEDKSPGHFQAQMLHALINALFYKAANMYLSRVVPVEANTSRSAQIVRDYKDLIKSKFRLLKRPAAYATLLHISVGHLNDTVKAVTGYSVTCILQQEVIGEAQRQLRYTAKTVKEIAFDLGYTDYKYFLRFYSKVVGMSPSIFRNLASHPQSDQLKVFVFKTDVLESRVADIIVTELSNFLPNQEINFDLEDCDHILRIKGKGSDPGLIRGILNNHGHTCEEIF